MNWILILWMFSPKLEIYYPMSVDGFKSKKACEDAGESIVKKSIGSDFRRVSFYDCYFGGKSK